MNGRSTLQGKRRRHGAWLLGGLTLSMLVGSMTAKGATAEACDAGEVLVLGYPVVAVIEGPDDASSEQVYWLSLYANEIHAPDGMALGDSWFQLVRTP